ncbi:MAG: 2,3-bisphosphoglycerate-independent phosphoglycerate mutase [Gammaproteobacteria bacterium]|nr:2,3-bisphosphoglycerate-independent phosphoglycerate mutase [Gammaproteobacteria bacterium]
MVDDNGAPRRPVLLIILDGFGVNPSKTNNAVAEANTPRFDEYFCRYPHTLLQASGRAAGLPDGQMGNSEVGHMAIGSGMVIRQDLVRIDDAIADGSFHGNPVLVEPMKRAAAAGRPLHLVGMVSDGGVHSHVRHLTTLIDMCNRYGVRPVVHMITDGRDTPPKAALEYLESVDKALEVCGGSIATVSGRYYAMDRDHRWERTALAWRAIVRGEGGAAGSAREAIEQSYESGVNDEFISPAVIDGGSPFTGDDEVILFNFRKDRPRQLVSALFDPKFGEFPRGAYEPVPVTCMTEYDKWFGLPYAFEQEKPAVTLGQIISGTGLKQFHCAETEKYAHVTYFFNGGRGDPYPGEDRLIVPSPKVSTYDLAPDMSAREVADAVIEAIREDEYAFLVVNFANGDMVGHTAVRSAILQAVETMDREVGRLMDVAREHGYSIILTADHGNCDEMVDPISGEPQTQHSVYPVPCLIVDEVAWRLAIGCGLANITPTILHLMGLPRPSEIKAKSLLLGPIRS